MKTWFITGASRGFGREWALAALGRGDQVVATARNPESLKDLMERFPHKTLALQLDVTDRDEAFAAVNQGFEFFGRLDVVVNNAGYGQFGMIEELSEIELRDQIETNLFGALWVTQAAVPLLRGQGGGHFLQVSSIGGITAFPSVGAYNASKWALEGFSQALATEVSQFGIHVTIIEPGGFSTDWGGSSAKHAHHMPEYGEVRAAAAASAVARTRAIGDPAASARAVLKLVDAEKPPLRVFFGDGPLRVAVEDYERRLATWREWEALSLEAQG
jgi:NAD(P)-dependent dehydrogenase (short-subunit alcohol dehydrogenase family)